MFSYCLKWVDATQVNWSGNQNVDPTHRAAHDAPRSQKYWDEHNIERPDYAKTDAEVAAEKRQKNGNDSVWQTWMGSFMILFYATLGVAAVSAMGYGAYTGDWNTVVNNPVTAFIDQCINRISEATGMKGHKLGTSGVKDAQSTQGGMSEEEKRRIARLARFENSGPGRDLLDEMKED